MLRTLGVFLLIFAGCALVVFLWSHEAKTLTLQFPAELQLSPTEQSVDGAALQQAFFDKDGESFAFGIRYYPNPQHLTAEAWVRQQWDQEGLLVLEKLVFKSFDGVAVRDSIAWSESNGEVTAFPVAAVINLGDRILVLDHLNGSQVGVEEILKILSEAQVK